MSRGNRDAPGHPTGGGGQAAATETDAGATPGQPSMAKTLSGNAVTKWERAMKEELWK